jgi:hypothetical protein
MKTSLHDERLSFDVDYDLFYQLLKITRFAHLPEFLAYVREHKRQTTRNILELTKYHAANLVKHGYPVEYAYLRAQRHPKLGVRRRSEWMAAIEEGVALGKRLRRRRQKA